MGKERRSSLVYAESPAFMAGGSPPANPVGAPFERSDMLFWLKKAVSYWLMPLPLGLALMVAGLLLLRSARWPRAGRRLLVTGVLLLLVLSNKQVGHRSEE